MSSLLISNKKNLPILGRGVYLALGLAALMGCSSSSGSSNLDEPTVTISAGDAKRGAPGSVLREWWLNLPEGDQFVTKLRDVIAPNTNPSSKDSLTSLQVHSFTPGQESVVINWGTQDFGERVRGFITPPTTGIYHFLVSGDNQVQFWLSTDETKKPIEDGIADPACKAALDGTNMVCPTSTAETRTPMEYTKQNEFLQPSQTSKPIMLTAGKFYFFDWYHREGGGETHAMVKWAKPGQDPTKTDALEIVPASALVYPLYEPKATGTGTGGASGTGGATGTGGAK